MHAPAAHHRRQRRHARNSPLDRPAPVKERLAGHRVDTVGVAAEVTPLGRLGIAGATLLAGAAACVTTMTVSGHLAAAVGDRSVPPPLSVGAGLVALACGVHMPKQLVTLAVRHVRRGVADLRGRSGQPLTAMDSAAGDAAFRGIALAACLLTTGLLLALLPTLMRVANTVRDLLFEHFVWSWPALGLFNFLFAFTVLVGPVFVLGVTLALMHRIAQRTFCDPGFVPYWAVGGGGLGMLLLALADMNSMSPATVLAITPLPLLVVAGALGWRFTKDH